MDSTLFGTVWVIAIGGFLLILLLVVTVLPLRQPKR